jgi:hypothetical protein
MIITHRMASHCAILLVMLLAFSATAALADVSITLHFSPNDLSWARSLGYDLPSMPGCTWTTEVGAPMVPLIVEHVAIGPGERAIGVEVVSVEMEPLTERRQILPTQPPLPLSNPPEVIDPDPRFYGSEEPYPGWTVRLGAEGSMGGYRVTSVLIAPLQYRPLTGEVLLCRQVSLVVKTASGPIPKPVTRTTAGAHLRREAVESLVINAADLNEFAPPERILAASADQEVFEFLVVTSEALAPSYDPLVEWKTQKGVRAVVRTSEWISAHYEGRDIQEQIRNYLKVAYADSGMLWVLLGGDVSVLPERRAIEGSTYIPCDMYFSDLDGTWDYNGNGDFGEVQDSTDLFPDVYVARAPVESKAEVGDFITKVVSYEMAEAMDYQRSIVFLADSLDAWTDSGDAKDSIEVNCVPLHLQPVTKLYARYGNLSRTRVLQELELGHGLFNHDGHGNTGGFQVGHGSISGSDFYNLTNGPRYSMFYTLGCYCGNFPADDCVGEQFVRSPAGGGYFVGNSRYGWYRSGNAHALSGEFDQEWWCQLLQEDHYHAGETMAYSKVPLIPQASDDGTHRYIMFELNLFGDPETPIWTDELDILEIVAPDSIAMESAATCTVVAYRSGVPEAEARVCLYRPQNFYQVQETDGSGHAVFTLDGATPGQLMVTATARNARPVLGSVAVYPDYPYAQYAGHTIDDSDGFNPNGRAEPGETVRLIASLENVGKGTITGVEAGLSAIDGSGYVSVTQSASGYPDIPEGETVDCRTPYIFSVDHDCPEGYWATMVLDIIADGGFSRSDTFQVLIKQKYVLLIDDDGEGEAEQKMIESLENLGTLYDLAPSVTQALPELRYYEWIIWMTGIEAEATLTVDDRDSLMAAMDDGAALFLTGQNIGNDIGETDFYRDYLHATCTDDSVGDFIVYGINGDSLLISGQRASDAITPINGADSVLYYASAKSAAVASKGRHTVIYFGFGFEGIKESGEWTSPDSVLAMVLRGSVEEIPEPGRSASVFSLGRNRPNPFTGSCTMVYELPAKTRTSLVVYNVLGQRVKTLVDGVKDAGSHLAVWDGQDDRGTPVAAGVYFCRLEAGERSAIRKLVRMQ